MISAIQNCSKLQIHRFQKKFPSNSRIHNFIVNTYSLWSRCWQTYHFKFRDFQYTENSWPKKRDLGGGSVVYTVWLHRYYFIKDIVRAIYYLEKAIPINNPVFDLRDNRTRQWVIFVTYCISKYYVDLKLEKREESTYVVARFFKHP